ncbi:MAG: RES family NAD+ phosphorylase [Bryobacterales bacterium]|nr:RES family NAD+ phosphorylase [Bryobacterales bacterium]
MKGGYDPGRIRRQLRTVWIELMFRVIHKSLRANPLAAGPAPSRFSDPTGEYAVLYAAETVPCCLWEAVVRNRLTLTRRRELPRADIEARIVVSRETREYLTLVDLRGDGPIQIGVSPAVAHDSNHASGRALPAATLVHVPEADGFLFASRFTGHLCTAVFDRAIGKLRGLSVTPLIESADFLEALDDYDIFLTTPSA